MTFCCEAMAKVNQTRPDLNDPLTAWPRSIYNIWAKEIGVGSGGGPEFDQILRNSLAVQVHKFMVQEVYCVLESRRPKLSNDRTNRGDRACIFLFAAQFCCRSIWPWFFDLQLTCVIMPAIPLLFFKATLHQLICRSISTFCPRFVLHC